MKIIVMSFYSAITRFRLLNRRGFAASSLRLMPTLMIILDNDISGGAAVFVKTPGAPAIPLLLNTWLFIILGFNRLFRHYFENPTHTLFMSPKRTGLRRRRRVNIRPNIDVLSAELHLREQQQASAIDSLRPLPLYTTEQLAIMNLQPDTRYPGRPVVTIDE